MTSEKKTSFPISDIDTMLIKTPAVYQKVTVGALTYCRDNQSQLIDNPGNNNNSNSSSNALRVTVSWQQSEWIFLTTDNGSERI